jgi:hypothetical protein
MRHAWILGLAAIAITPFTQRASGEPPLAEKYLHEGKLADGEKALRAELARNPKDDQNRFGLGTLQFIRAVEHLGQTLHRYGLRTERGRQLGLPFLRLPIPNNPKPETLSYAALRKIFQEMNSDLKKAEATLDEIRDDKVKLPLRIGLVRLDMTGDGKASEPFRTILARYFGGAQNLPKNNDELLIVFT